MTKHKSIGMNHSNTVSALKPNAKINFTEDDLVHRTYLILCADFVFACNCHRLCDACFLFLNNFCASDTYSNFHLECKRFQTEFGLNKMAQNRRPILLGCQLHDHSYDSLLDYVVAHLAVPKAGLRQGDSLKATREEKTVINLSTQLKLMQCC